MIGRIPYVLIFAAALGACGRDRPRERTSSASTSIACPSRAEGSRWASAGARYRETAAYGRTRDQWLYEVGGIAFHDSLLYVYDTPESRIVVLDSHLQPVRSFGRRGSGPGEFGTSLDQGMKGSGWRWLDVTGDTVAVFDGIRVQLFSLQGKFIAQRLSALIGTPALSERMERIAYDGATFVGPSGGYDLALLQPPADRYRWDLTAHTPRSRVRVLSLKLTPLPTVRNGVPFRGPEQARPLWGPLARLRGRERRNRGMAGARLH